MNVRLYEVLFLVCGLAYAELMLQLEPLCGPYVSLTSLIAVFLSLQLKQLGHSVDKVEYIVMGGTFMVLDEYLDTL